MKLSPALSIVIPCFDEEACLPELHRRVSAVAHAVTTRVNADAKLLTTA